MTSDIKKIGYEKFLLFFIAFLGVLGSIYIIIHNSSPTENIHYRESKHQVYNNSVSAMDIDLED